MSNIMARWLVLICGLTGFSSFAVIDSSSPPTLKDTLPYRPGRLIVKLYPGYPISLLERNFIDIKATVVQSFSLVEGLNVFEFDENIDVENARVEFLRHHAVEYAEPDYFYRAAADPNDPRYSSQWALENSGQTGGTADADINAQSMWHIETGDRRVIVGVIDTGIDYTHPDLVDNLWHNTSEIPNNGIDDDQNGYVDDIHGINAINNNGNPMDDNIHGTHVAGTIGAKGNNNVGVVGVAQNVQIIACKFLSSSGSGSIADAIQCMEYFAKLKSRLIDPVDITATNNSWGGGGRSQAMYDAIKAHLLLDILFIAAAGNESSNNDNVTSYPSNYQLANVISVAATDHNDRLASFSNFGKKTVHVAAPGVKILSTTLNHGYGELSGTSMATPHVTGLAAVIKSHFSDINYQGLKNLIITSGTPIQALQNTTISGRRIRGADTNGRGALTCQDQRLTVRQTPQTNNHNIPVGAELLLSALNINCKEPGGVITLYQDESTSIVLEDQGTNGDVLLGDGIYSLLWRAEKAGTYGLNFGNGDIIQVVVFATEPLKSYKVHNNIAFNYEDIGGTRLRFKDESIHQVSVPFPIHFAGNSLGFKTLYVGSNGTISFSETSNPGYENKPLLIDGIADLITPFWDDLSPASNSDSDIYVALKGTAPNRQLIIEWWKVKHYGGVGLGTFQAVFYENSPDIRFNYLDTELNNTAYSEGASATVGVQTNPEDAAQYSHNQKRIPSRFSLLFKLE